MNLFHPSISTLTESLVFRASLLSPQRYTYGQSRPIINTANSISHILLFTIHQSGDDKTMTKRNCNEAVSVQSLILDTALHKSKSHANIRIIFINLHLKKWGRNGKRTATLYFKSFSHIPK